ncbi:DUF1259 domain-containing protein [Lysinibacillus sp. NPDC056959]
MSKSAVHSHRIYSSPTILYVHFQSIEPPLTIAPKFA